MGLLPDERYHAIVVDEGQDFATDWLQTLDLLLHAPGEDLLWVFHDPGQALSRDDVVATSGLGRWSPWSCSRTDATRRRWRSSRAGSTRGRLDALLYVALTRATSSLTVIATPGLVALLR